MNATFFYTLLLEDSISRNGFPEERGGCEIGRKELKWQKAGRRSLQRATKRPRKAGPLFHPLQLKNRREWDQATIWPQLRAMCCRSTKINGNNSTLDAHHYPDGVLGERRRPPNREQRQHRHWSNAAAQLDDSRFIFVSVTELRTDHRAPLQQSPLSALN